MIESTYGVSLDLSVVPLVVLISIYGTHQTQGVVPYSMLVFEYGILTLGVKCSSMLPLEVGF